jgi:hypothetical protein
LLLQTSNNNDSNISVQLRINSVIYAFATNVKNGLNKIIVTYNSSEMVLYLNGFRIKSKPIPSFPSLYTVRPFQYFNARAYGRVYLTALWKTKLSDADATKLTAL